MYSVLFLSPLLFAISGIASPAPRALEARAAPSSTCNRDNLLRCFIATPGPASAYCSSVIGTSATTTTVATTTPTTTLTISRTSTTTTPVTTTATSTTSTTTTTATTQTIQSVTVATTTVTVFVTVTATTTTTAIVATATVTPVLKFKRDSGAIYFPQALGKRAVDPPACVTKDGSTPTSYPYSRITSACSCIGVTRSTVRATSTAPPRTVTTTQSLSATATSTQTATVTVTVTVVSTSTISTTQTSTSSTTSTELTTTTGATVTSTIPGTTTTTASPSVCTPTVPACASPTLTNSGGTKFVKTFQGCGVRNPNDFYYDLNISYNPGTDLCFAIQNCANSATGFSSDSAPNGGFSYDLYQTNDGLIQCNVFADGTQATATRFTQADPNVKLTLGYTRI